MIILLIFAFLAGIVTVLSPCILPILPIILTSTLGGQNIGHARPIGVVTGFILSFTFFTLFLSVIVRLSGISADTVRLFSIFVIAGFGISLLIPRFQILVEQIFSKLAKFMPSGQNRTGFAGGLLIGFSVGLLWTPCVGPILASVISLAITGTVTFDAFLITLSYSLGTAIPMFLIMLGGQSALRRVPWLLSNLGNIQKIFGVLMILTAVGIFFNIDRKFQTFILNTFPQYGIGLTKLEDNDLIRSQLDKKDNDVIKKDDMGKPMFDFIEPKGNVAPEIIPGGAWFNLPAGRQVLTLAQLRGKVVIIDFWTYSCINCQRTFPYLKTWHEKYKDHGLVIIGVHSPEFEFEKSEKNLLQAIKDFGLTYPIVQDNEFATWRAYNNRYWPAKYFIDKDGYIRYTHFGEGAYDESEKVIQELLAEAGARDVSLEIKNPEYQINAKTPETYFGSLRMEYLYPNGNVQNGTYSNLAIQKNIPLNSFTLAGSWIVSSEYSESVENSVMEQKFNARKVFLVMRVKDGQEGKVRILLDGKTLDATNSGKDVRNGFVPIVADTLYELIDLKNGAGEHLLRLEFTPGIQIFAFTFG